MHKMQLDDWGNALLARYLHDLSKTNAWITSIEIAEKYDLTKEELHDLRQYLRRTTGGHARIGDVRVRKSRPTATSTEYFCEIRLEYTLKPGAKLCRV